MKAWPVLALVAACGPAGRVSEVADLSDASSYDDERCQNVDGGAQDLDAGVTSLSGPLDKITLSAGGPAYRLADGCTTLQFRVVHPIVQIGPGGFYSGVFSATAGLPYASTHGGWIEIPHKTTLYSRGWTFTIENGSCVSVQASCGDCVYDEVRSCDLTVTTTAGRASPIVPSAVSHLFSLNSRFDALVVEHAGAQFVAVRGLGFDVSVDISKNPPEPIVLRGGMDFVTSFGVANMDYDYFNEQVIGAATRFTIGPHDIVSTIKDVGNTNTHCYTGVCLNVFDIDLSATVADAVPRIPAIVSYD